MSKAEAALLVVDDIEDNRYALTRRLAREGYANVATAEDYLPKPFNPTLLRAPVGACLERKRLHDQVAAQAAGLAAWNRTDTEPAGELTLKGFHRPVRAFNVRGLRS